MPKVPKKLKAEWAKRLAESGFKDAENEFGYLVNYDAGYFKERYTPLEFETQQRFFELCRQLLHEVTWKKPGDKEIWELFCDGLSPREIAKKLGDPYTYYTVEPRVRYYMGFIKRG